MNMGTVQTPPRIKISRSSQSKTSSAVFDMGPKVVHWIPPTSCRAVTSASTYHFVKDARVRYAASRGRQSESMPAEWLVKKNAYRGPSTGTWRSFSVNVIGAGVGEEEAAKGGEGEAVSPSICTGDTLLVLLLVCSIWKANDVNSVKCTYLESEFALSNRLIKIENLNLIYKYISDY